MDSRALEWIKKLSEAPGASGHEDAVARLAGDFARSFGKVQEDKLRNVYVYRSENAGKRPLVMLDAHTDEVSFMVQAIKPNGTLAFVPLGGWVRQAVAGHRVRVRTVNGDYIPGVIASKPPHFMSDAEKNAAPDIAAMSIDVGASSAREATEVYGVRPGEPVVPDVAFEHLEERGLMIGKAFDCRLGCAAILGTLAALHGQALDVDVVGAFAVQEEVGTRGALVTANCVRPDLAIVFEGCPADDTVVEPWAVQTAIGRGPMLRYIDARMITHPRFQRFALDLAGRLGIPVQTAVRSGGSTDGAPIHTSCLGVPCIVIGLPVRYIHTHYGIAATADYENAVRLGAAVLSALNDEVFKAF